MVSSYCLGALAGCILTVFIGDLLGRRRMMWLAMCFVVVGATLQTSSYTVAHLVIGRVITGMFEQAIVKYPHQATDSVRLGYGHR